MSQCLAKSEWKANGEEHLFVQDKDTVSSSNQIQENTVEGMSRQFRGQKQRFLLTGGEVTATQ